MYFSKIVCITNYLIKIFLASIAILLIWFIGIKGTLDNPGTKDVRIITYFVLLTLFMVLVKFVFGKAKRIRC